MRICGHIDRINQRGGRTGRSTGAERRHKKGAPEGRAFGGMYWLVYLGDILDYF